MSPEITFNVIFVRDTVPILAWLVRSLEAWSDCRFRLVSNGCRDSENTVLRHMCASNERLEFQQVSRDRVVEHGSVLTQLQRQETSDYFAFMDSDILATGPFLPEFVDHLSSASAVFSCPPVWSNDEFEVVSDGFQLLSGHFNQLADGFCVGSSYFAVYHNDVLSDCMRDTGITFSRYAWAAIPEDIQEELAESGRALGVYDTGKCLNILLGLRGFRREFVRSKHLQHLGGVSCEAVSRLRWLCGLLPLGSAMLPQVARTLLRMASRYDGWVEMMDGAERGHHKRRQLRQLSVRRHLTKLLRSLTKREPCPQSFIDADQQLTAKVQGLEKELRLAYAEYRPATNRRSRAA